MYTASSPDQSNLPASSPPDFGPRKAFIQQQLAAFNTSFQQAQAKDSFITFMQLFLKAVEDKNKLVEGAQEVTDEQYDTVLGATKTLLDTFCDVRKDHRARNVAVFIFAQAIEKMPVFQIKQNNTPDTDNTLDKSAKGSSSVSLGKLLLAVLITALCVVAGAVLGAIIAAALSGGTLTAVGIAEGAVAGWGLASAIIGGVVGLGGGIAVSRYTLFKPAPEVTEQVPEIVDNSLAETYKELRTKAYDCAEPPPRVR